MITRYWVNAMIDKIVLSNNIALETKYGPQGLKTVLTAVKGLIAADKTRGLRTELIDISSAAAMKNFRGAVVLDPSDQQQNKHAVDAIHAGAKPDYLVILDAPDVIPHLALKNPLPDDKDGDVPSDLPYASDAPFTSRDTKRYAAVTRVVGRIPGITGAKTPEYLVGLLDIAARFKSLKREDYLSAFVISAEVWKKSTQQSADNIFDGKATIKTSPTTNSPGVQRLLKPLSHFINCHGAETDPQFYGEHSKNYPVAMTSKDVASGASKNSVIAAECCFGAQLYDPTWASNQQPISNVYLGAGAIGYLGSTNTSYGPAKGNGAADLVTQHFLIGALNGASLGRAFLQSRQKFVRGEKMEDPVNIKTLAQFLLLGDPSLHACAVPAKTANLEMESVDDNAARKVRRVALAAAGKAAADSSGFPGARTDMSQELKGIVQKIATERGFKAAQMAAFQIVGGLDYGKEMKARKVKQQVVVMTDHTQSEKSKEAVKLPQTRILVAHAQDSRVVQVSEYIRR